MKMRSLISFFVFGLVVGGTAFAQSDDVSSEEVSPRVSGNGCVTAPAGIGYRPSLYECNGAAAVILRAPYRDEAFSVVVRRVGQYNDRDPNNTSCALATCSPYKVQKKIELPEFQVNCLGDSGFSDFFVPVTRISIKYQAVVTNSSDPHQFQQYCLPSKISSLN